MLLYPSSITRLQNLLYVYSYLTITNQLTLLSRKILILEASNSEDEGLSQLILPLWNNIIFRSARIRIQTFYNFRINTGLSQSRIDNQKIVD